MGIARTPSFSCEVGDLNPLWRNPRRRCARRTWCGAAVAQVRDGGATAGAARRRRRPPPAPPATGAMDAQAPRDGRCQANGPLSHDMSTEQTTSNSSTNPPLLQMSLARWYFSSIINVLNFLCYRPSLSYLSIRGLISFSEHVWITKLQIRQPSRQPCVGGCLPFSLRPLEAEFLVWKPKPWKTHVCGYLSRCRSPCFESRDMLGGEGVLRAKINIERVSSSNKR